MLLAVACAVGVSVACGAFDSDDPPATTDAGSSSSSSSSGGSGSSGASGGSDGGAEAGAGCVVGGNTLVCADFSNTSQLVQGGFERIAGDPALLSLDAFQTEPNNTRLHVRIPKGGPASAAGYLVRAVPDSFSSVRISARVRNGSDVIDNLLDLLSFEADNFRLVVRVNSTGKLTVAAGTPTTPKQYQVVDFTAAQERQIDLALAFGATNTIAVDVDGKAGAAVTIDDFRTGVPAGNVSFAAGARYVLGSGGAWLDDVKLVVTK